MKAAIYARVSADDDRSEDNRSTRRQVERALAYAKAQGWTVSKDHIYTDEGVSGAEFERRHGLVKMLARLKEFNYIIMSEQSRLGRDTVRTPFVIDQICSAGVKIHLYLTKEELRASTDSEQIMVALKSFSDSMYRAMTAQRTRDALLLRAERGQCAGGRVYGYDNVWVYPDGRRVVAPVGEKKENRDARTDWQINKEQAAVVRGIFRAYADGYGYGVIAKALNGERDDDSRLRRKGRASYELVRAKYFKGRTPPSPHHGAQGSGSWCPTAVRGMLYRVRYVGKLQYGEYRNVRTPGRVGKCVKQDEFLVVDRPDLAIVPRDLWERVQARLGATRAIYVRANGGEAVGRPEAGRASKFLLSGLGRCDACGANIVATGGQKYGKYACSHNQNRGDRVCVNDVRERIPVIDSLVIGHVERRLLDPDRLARIAERAVAKVAQLRRANPTRPREIDAELKRLRRELQNLVALAASGRAPKTIIDEIAKREARIVELERERAKHQAPALNELDLRWLRTRARERIASVRDEMGSDIEGARRVLRTFLRDREGQFAPLTFVPTERKGRRTFVVKGIMSAAPILLHNVGTEERT